MTQETKPAVTEIIGSDRSLVVYSSGWSVRTYLRRLSCGCEVGLRGAGAALESCITARGELCTVEDGAHVVVWFTREAPHDV